MDIKGLLEIGRWSGDLVEKTVKWNGHTFEIFVKKDLSPADFEFIYASEKGADDSHMARRVARCIFIAGEPIGYENAKALKSSLIAVMCGAINEVQDKIGEAKKT
jgi:hypothetical protein